MILPQNLLFFTLALCKLRSAAKPSVYCRPFWVETLPAKICCLDPLSAFSIDLSRCFIVSYRWIIFDNPIIRQLNNSYLFLVRVEVVQSHFYLLINLVYLRLDILNFLFLSLSFHENIIKLHPKSIILHFNVLKPNFITKTYFWYLRVWS